MTYDDDSAFVVLHRLSAKMPGVDSDQAWLDMAAMVRSLLAENESLKAALREACEIGEEYIAHRRTTAVLLASDHTANSIKSACADDAARLASLRQKADSK